MATEKATESTEKVWTLVHDEAPDQLKFEQIGEEYDLIYMDQEEIDPQDDKDPDKRFTQLQFRYERRPVVHNAGYEMREAFASMPKRTWVRVRYVKDVDVKAASPMKSFKVWQGPAATDADLSDG
jgi:hypothetical protein